MRISPLDIRQQQFTVKWLRGFDIHEVDAFLDDIAEDYEAVLKENAQLKEQVGTFEERARGLAERERALQDTLVTTHRLGDEMKATARREADLLTREAELRSEKIIEEGHAEAARIRSEIQTPRRLVRATRIVSAHAGLAARTDQNRRAESGRVYLRPPSGQGKLMAPAPITPIAPVRWADDRLVLLDQTLLPTREVERRYERWEDVAEAIRTLVVRGAPAIGVAAAFGVALAARQSRAMGFDGLIADLELAIKGLAATRPTAVHLLWALERMKQTPLASPPLPIG